METKTSSQFKQSYKADSNALKLIRENIKTYLESIKVNVNDISVIVIAVNEACMNVIQHANNGKYNGEISICIKPDLLNLTIDVSDNADFEEYLSTRKKAREALKPGGLGLHIISEIMDDVEHFEKKNASGNILTMTKVLSK